MRRLLALMLGLLLAGCSMAPIALDATATAVLSGLGAGLVAPRLMNMAQPAPTPAPAPAALPSCASVVSGACIK